MKLSLLFSLLTLLNAAASVYSQSKGLNLSLQNAKLLEVFNVIENQSKFKFFYQNEQIDINRTVSVNATNAKVEEVLDELFANENVKYRVLDDNLVLLTTEKIQQGKISGTILSVKDDTPIPGVSVIEKGTANGAISDKNGKYSLTLQGANPTIIFTFIGYKAQEVLVNKQTIIDVKLEEDFTQLEEVVVVGYGFQKKSSVTGAITSIKSADIQSTSIARAEQVLQGKTSGVQVIPSNGSPGSGMSVRIRGYSSNGNSNPIFIVDGVKTADIAYLDPNDIASMDILKDAASAAIYGAEGGNGVVMITTKQGKSGRTQISYDFQRAWQSAGHLPKLMDASQYATYMQEAGLITNADQTYNTDWLKEIFETGSLQKHHLSLSGGNDRSTFLLSISYLLNNGIIKQDKDKYERYSARFNSEHKMKEWLKVGNNFTYSHSKRNAIDETRGEFGGVIGSALQMDPNTPVEFTGPIPAKVQKIIEKHPNVVKAPSGNYYGISQYVNGEVWNPFVNLAVTHGETKMDYINGNVFAELTPLKGLTITTRFGLDLTYQNVHSWNPTYYYTDERSNGTTLVSDFNTMNRTWTWENFANYTRKFGNHNITLLAGTSAEEFNSRVSNAQGGPMVIEKPAFAELSYLSSQGNDLISGFLQENKKISYFGRFSYDYAGRYMLQGSLRRDGAGLSQLPKDGRWGTFPSISAGWVVSNESFFPKSEYFTYAKFRGSWGQNGSLSNLQNYSYASLITGTNNNSTMQYPLSTGSLYTILEPSQTANPNLKWETSDQTDIGLDLKFLNDQIMFSVDYFNKKTKDLITTNSPPFETGNTASPINGGDVENKGWEFDLGFHNNVGELKYTVNLNFSTLKNKVTYINPYLGRIIGSQVGTGWNATMFEQGYPIWHFYGYKTCGINPTTGDPIFLTKDGEGRTAAGVTSDDMQDIGSPIPKRLYGGSINLEYKGIDFTLAFSGMAGNKVMMGWIRNDRNTVNRPTEFFDDRWTPDNTGGSKPKAATDTKTWNSDQIIFDGSFLRIQQIQLGYTLPSSLTKKVKLNSLRLYVSMDNFFIITSYPGMDPQASPQNQNTNQNNSNGIDRGTYPMPRDIMLGASVSF